MAASSAKTEIDIPQKSIVLPDRKVHAKSHLNIPYAETEMRRLKCVTCNKTRATRIPVLPSESNDVESDDYYRAQPVDWMSTEFSNREHEGTLACTEGETSLENTIRTEFGWDMDYPRFRPPQTCRSGNGVDVSVYVNNCDKSSWHRRNCAEWLATMTTIIAIIAPER